MSATPDTNNEEDPSSFEHVLEELGMPGRFQITQIFIISASLIMSCFNSLGFIFQGYTPHHVCNYVNDSEIIFQLGLQNDSSASVRYGSCDIIVSSNQSNEIKDIATLSCPNGRDFLDAKHTTWISEWDLVCESKGRAELSFTVFTIGQLIGGIILSSALDRFGRRPVFIVCCIAICLLETTIIFAPNIYMIIGIKFVCGFFSKGSEAGGFVYALEFVIPRHRQVYGVLNALIWVSCSLVVATTAYITRTWDWKYLQVTMSVFGLLSLPCLFFLNESPRWLAANYKIDQAMIVLRKASRQNAKDFRIIKETFMRYVNHTFSFKTPEDMVPLDNGTNDNYKEAIHTIKKVEKLSILTLFRNKSLRFITGITLFIWLTNVSAYYGLYLMSGKIGGNRFLNFCMMALVEIPGILCSFYMMKVYGRRINISIFLALTGTCLVISSLLFSFEQYLAGSSIASTALYILGTFALSGSFSVLFIMTPEFFPTNLRTTAFGFVNCASRVGSMVAPYMALLFDIVSWGPNIIFAVMCIGSIILVMFLPETKGKDLPNTLEEMMAQRKKKELAQNCCLERKF